MARMGSVPSNFEIKPGESIRRNAQDNGFEVFTPIKTINGMKPDHKGNVTLPLEAKIPANFGVQGPTELSIPYFKAIGLNAVRFGGLSPVPWNPAWNLGTRARAATFKAAGFWTQYGVVDAVSQNGYTKPITAANWQYLHDTVVAEAAFCQSQGLVFDAFVIGNELENYIDNTTLTYVGLYNNLQQLALDVKAVYSGPVVYNFFSWPATNYEGWYPGKGWAEGGIGNLDMFSIHPYPTMAAPVVTVANGTVENAQWVSEAPNDNFEYSLNFNGTNSRVYLGSAPALSGLTDLTWAGWVKQDVAAKGTVWSNFYHFGTNKGQEIVLGGYQSKPTIQFYQGNVAAITSFPSYIVGQWFYLAITQVGSLVNIYVNGQNILKDAPLTPVGPHGTLHSFLGAEGGTGYRFSGEMCGVGIWNRGLSEQEIKAAQSSTLPQSGLVGEYLVANAPVTPATIDFTKVDAMLSSWSTVMGNKLYVSEFNISSNGLKIAGATPEQRKEWIEQLYEKIKVVVPENKIIFYKYTGDSYIYGGNDSDAFNLQSPSGQMSPMWEAFLK